MSAWQLVNAWGGFRADQVDRTLTFAPKADDDYRVLWSSGTAWGELVRRGGELSLRLHGGKLDVVDVIVDGKSYSAAELTQAGHALEPA
jgi:hypothetical protein